MRLSSLIRRIILTLCVSKDRIFIWGLIFWVLFWGKSKLLLGLRIAKLCILNLDRKMGIEKLRMISRRRFNC